MAQPTGDPVDEGVPFAMLSDSVGRVGKVYGVYDEDAGVETRGRVIIDPDGINIVLNGYQLGIITHAKFGNATHMKT